MYRAGEKKALFQAYLMKSCILRTVSASGSSGADFPSETVQIEWGEMEWIYKKLDENANLKGSSTASWSRIGNAM
jgi:type VI protein secretion system component Hcp